MWDRLADRRDLKSKGIDMLIVNDRKRMDLNLDLDWRGAAMPRELDLAELEAVEGGNPVVLAAGAAIAGAAAGAVAGAVVVAGGFSLGVAIANRL